MPTATRYINRIQDCDDYADALSWAGGVVFNEAGADVDFRVEGVGEANALFVQGSDGRVGIGTASPNAPLEVKGAKPGGNVGGFQSGHFHVTGDGTAQFSNAVITGHNAYDSGFGANTQLWYLGSTSSGNHDIALINRQNADICFNTDDTLRMVIDAAGNVGIGLTPTANMVGLSIEAGVMTIKETTTPTADADYGKVYTKNDNKLYFQDGAGGEHEIAFAV